MNFFVVLLAITTVLGCPAICKDLLTDLVFIKLEQTRMGNDLLRYQKLTYLIQKRIIFKYRCDFLIPHLPQIRLAIFKYLKQPSLNEQLDHWIKIYEKESQGVINDLPPHIPIKNEIFIPPVIEILIPEHLREKFLNFLRPHNKGDSNCESDIDAIAHEAFGGDELKILLFKEALFAYWNLKQVEDLIPSHISKLLEFKKLEAEKEVLQGIKFLSHSFFKIHEAIYTFNFGYNQATFIFFFYYLAFTQKLSCLCEEIEKTPITFIHAGFIDLVNEFLKFSRGFQLHKSKIAEKTFTGWLCHRDSQTILFPPSDCQPKGNCFKLSQISLYFINSQNSNNNNILRYYTNDQKELVIFTTNSNYGKAKFNRMMKAINLNSYDINQIFSSNKSLHS